MAGDVEKVRAFIAIHPPRDVVGQLIALVAKLKRTLKDDAFRWVKLEQLHLTLQFLGYIPREQLEEFQEVVAGVVSRHKSFYLKTESLGCFPSVSRARVLWVGLTGEGEALQRLKSDLDKGLVPLGYQPEERPFHPHLTLARIPVLPASCRTLLQQQVAAHDTYSSGEFTVQTVELMQSFLSPKGASYRLLGSFSLQSV
ncbi:MAG: RNA 2',3'-cyclic phosphodiesterase [Verrucomicrobia bacterium]|nr:RNA 2',3'-cyclic phosphodiesterase [Verrucomicrobiota bacterium]